MVFCCFRSRAKSSGKEVNVNVTRINNDKDHFYPDFIDEVQEKSCLRIIAKLSEDEKETAARSSYQYFSLTDSFSQNKGSPSINSQRDAYALAMARRHLIAEQDDEEIALAKMKNTLRFRKEMNVDAIRRCFYVKDSKIHTELREAIELELKNGKYFVRGNDIDQSSIYLVISRIVATYDPDWYLIGQIYNIERAIARTERLSHGQIEKINVIFEYKDFNRKNNPSLSLIKELILCLKDHYPERMARLIILDAPFSFRSIWALVKPFIDPRTKKKVMFISGDQNKSMKLKDIFPKDQAMKFLLPEGQKSDEVNMESYMNTISFDYDVDNM
mmetsp:Transcript_1266/g.1810  ORF Transcript_1266/g.1810 Transcript_1266/m.1810 type:complete len:330 (+) Transcript_1266:76-1065(+)